MDKIRLAYFDRFIERCRQYKFHRFFTRNFNQVVSIVSILKVVEDKTPLRNLPHVFAILRNYSPFSTVQCSRMRRWKNKFDRFSLPKYRLLRVENSFSSSLETTRFRDKSPLNFFPIPFPRRNSKFQYTGSFSPTKFFRTSSILRPVDSITTHRIKIQFRSVDVHPPLLFPPLDSSVGDPS